jgi:hypothetical protein
MDVATGLGIGGRRIREVEKIDDCFGARRNNGYRYPCIKTEPGRGEKDAFKSRVFIDLD